MSRPLAQSELPQTATGVGPVGRTRVKICGITRPAQGQRVAALGADAIGLVFWPGSTRHVSIETAAAIASALPPMVATFGVLVDPEPREVEEILARVRIDVLQFHGEEAPRDCARYHVPYVKSIRVRGGERWDEIVERYAGARALLLDTYRAGRPGGTGEAFDWSLVPGDPGKPIILAGGLEAGNVARAVREVRPYAVDVSGGVERAPGDKDPERVREFIGEVMRCRDSSTSHPRSG